MIYIYIDKTYLTCNIVFPISAALWQRARAIFEVCFIPRGRWTRHDRGTFTIQFLGFNFSKLHFNSKTIKPMIPSKNRLQKADIFTNTDNDN